METSHRLERKRRSETQKREVVRGYQRSGKTQRAFCADAGISVPTLHAWRKAMEGPADKSGRLMEVRMDGREVPGGTVAGEVVLDLGKGLSLRIPGRMPVTWIANLVGAIQCGA